MDMNNSKRRLSAGRWAWLLMAGAAAVPAQERMSAALLDWRPRDAFTTEALAQIPAYCTGAYIQPNYGRGQRLPRPELADTASQPVFASADSSNYDPGGVAEFRGQVEVEQGNFWARSEWATYDEQQQVAVLGDNVLMRGPSLVLMGDRAHYNAVTGYFELNDASYLVHDLELRGAAGQISRPSPNVLAILEGRYTTCAPNDNAWSLEARRIHLDRESGFGEAYHSIVRVADVPVLYLPYFNFPIDDRRKSGFLYPSFGTSNTGRGIFLSTPYYFNLAPNYDATYTPSYIHGRGLHSELEFRHLNSYSATELRLGYLDRDREYRKDRLQDLRERQADDPNAPPLRVPEWSSHRWALDLENEIQWGDRLLSELDYNVVSDDDYLGDLNRDLRIDSATHLERYWRLTYQSENWSIQSLVQGFQTLDPLIAPASRPYMRLPSLSFEGLWTDSLFEYELNSEYTYFWRSDENIAPAAQVHGNRLRLNPRLALPLQTIWGFFTPAVRLDYTLYALEERQPGEREHISRTVPFYTLDTGIYLDRLLDIGESRFNQSLEPRLFYVYSSRRDQQDIPLFDTSENTFRYNQLFRDDRFSGGDRVGDNNRLSLGLTTRFTELETGIERARFSLGQIYFFQDRHVTLAGAAVPESRSESVLAGEMELKPTSLLDVKVEGLWDPRERRTEQGSTTLTFHSRDYSHLLSLSHRYTADVLNGAAKPGSFLEQTDVAALFPVTDRISLIGRWFFDLEQHRTIGTLAGIEYSSCCWRLQVVAQSYLEEAGEEDRADVDRGLFVRFYLKGLTGIGNDLESALADALPGFEARELYLTGPRRGRSVFGY